MFAIRNITVNRKLIYIISLSILTVLLSLCFILGQVVRYIAAPFLAGCVTITLIFVKKRNILLLNKREVLMIMALSSMVLVSLYFLTGLKFGYVKNYTPLNITVFLRYILPISFIIVSTEIIRCVLLTEKSALSCTLVYFMCVMSEVTIFSGLGHSITFFRFMDFVGMTLFPALSANLLYNYVSARYGALPNIAYRLVISLYPYVFKSLSAIPDSIVAFAKLAIPLILYWFLRLLYEKRIKRATKRPSRWRYVGVGVSLALVISFIMLISCQFRFGMLVIGSGSMTGELNKGDALVYESFHGQTIETGQVIVFEKGGVRTVHRVVDVKHINGVTRYYTKGDANEKLDDGYITAVNIVGTAEIKLPYIGYPTLWMRNLFN